MAKIKTSSDRIIIEGHANTNEECETITLFCDALKQSKDFKTIKYESGYAEFEKIGATEDLKFVETTPEKGVTILAGTYKFKDSISLPSSDITEDISFKYTQYGQTYTATSMNIQSSGVIYYKGATTVTAFQGTWQSTAQTITFESDQSLARGDFYNWFVANATVVLEAGTYKWIDSPDVDISTVYSQSINFTSGGESFGAIMVGAYTGIDYASKVDSAIKGKTYNSSDGWLEEAYKTITTSEDQYVGYDFYNYAILGNQLVKQEATYKIKGKWDFNSKLTGIETSTSYIDTEISFKYGNRQCSKIRNGNRYLAYYFDDTSAYDDVYNNNTSLWIYEDARLIDFGDTEQEVTQSFYTWLTANAEQVSIIEKGFYKFVDAPTAPSADITQAISFTANKIAYTSIKTLAVGMIQYTNTNGDLITTYTANGWGTSYQGIIVPEDAIVDKDFKTWFDANVTTYDEWDLRINGYPTGKWNDKTIMHIILGGITYKIRQPYTITTNLTNITADADNPTLIRRGETKTLKFYVDDGYDFPDDVTVDGADYTWEIQEPSSGSQLNSNTIAPNNITVNGTALSSLPYTLQNGDNITVTVPLEDVAITVNGAVQANNKSIEISNIDLQIEYIDGDYNNPVLYIEWNDYS